jgi:arylsulfatase A-like enzyme
LPSIYSLISSSYPITHGYTDLNNAAPSNWDKKKGHLADCLRKQGYSTMASSTSKIFTPAFGSHSGFDRFFYEPYPESGRTSRLITGRAIDHLEANKKGKNFLFLHYIDTHEPWFSPSYTENCKLPPNRTIDPNIEYNNFHLGQGDTKAEPLFTKDSIEILNFRLEQRIQEVDLHLQSLFDYIEKTNQDKETIVVLTGDHGYPHKGEGQPLLSDYRVRVPLLIKHPSRLAKRVKLMVSHGLDLGPTIASFAGTHIYNSTGTPLYPFDSFINRKEIISESVFSDKYKIAVRDEKYTYHYHCWFDKKNNTILLNSPIESYLFSNESKCFVDKSSNNYNIITSSKLTSVFKHVKINSKAFNYII